MTTIHTKEDLTRALQEDPEWKAAVRSFILTEELLTLPARFGHFVVEQQETNQRVDQFIAEQRQTNADQQQVNQRAESKLANTRLSVLLSNNRDMNPGLRVARDDAVEQGLVTD